MNSQFVLEVSDLHVSVQVGSPGCPRRGARHSSTRRTCRAQVYNFMLKGEGAISVLVSRCGLWLLWEPSATPRRLCAQAKMVSPSRVDLQVEGRAPRPAPPDPARCKGRANAPWLSCVWPRRHLAASGVREPVGLPSPLPAAAAAATTTTAAAAAAATARWPGGWARFAAAAGARAARHGARLAPHPARAASRHGRAVGATLVWA